MTRRRMVPIALIALLVLAAAGLTATLIRHHRIDAQVSSRAEMTRVASDQAVAMLSYRHDTVDEQLAAASAGLTGDFRAQYDSLVTEAVAPSAKEKSIDTEVTVAGASIVSASGDTGSVLLFLNQVTTSADAPEPTTTGSRVVVDLTDVDGRWAVSGLSPV